MLFVSSRSDHYLQSYSMKHETVFQFSIKICTKVRVDIGVVILSTLVDLQLPTLSVLFILS